MDCSEKSVKAKPCGLFELGSTVATPGALACLRECNVDAADLIERHVTGDWGDLLPEDKKENEHSLSAGFRILSSYPMPNKKTIWIITEADRSVTTLLLPEEY